MKFREFASIQNREGFTKCIMEGAANSQPGNNNKILFFNVYLDSDTMEKWADKLVFGKMIRIYAYVDKANKNWSQLDIYKIVNIFSP